ncbi:MAG: hypothetical protein AAF310_02360 [Myxococcota bacterium]
MWYVDKVLVWQTFVFVAGLSYILTIMQNRLSLYLFPVLVMGCAQAPKSPLVPPIEKPAPVESKPMDDSQPRSTRFFGEKMGSENGASPIKIKDTKSTVDSDSMRKKTFPSWANEETVKSIEGASAQDVSRRIKELTVNIIKNKQSIDPNFAIRIINRVLSLLNQSLGELNQELCRNILYLLYTQDSLKEPNAVSLATQFVGILGQALRDPAKVSAWMGEYLASKKAAPGFWQWLKQFGIHVSKPSPLQPLKRIITAQNQGKDFTRALSMMQVVISSGLGEKMQAIRILLGEKYFPAAVLADQTGMGTDGKSVEQKGYFVKKLAHILQTQLDNLSERNMKNTLQLQDKLQKAAKRLADEPDAVAQQLRDADNPNKVMQALLNE